MTSTNLDLIGSAEAARILEVDRSTFLRWAKAGKIIPTVAGNGLTGEKFFDRAEVEALASKIKVAAAVDRTSKAGAA